MYTIEFYEDKNGNSELSDFLHMLHTAHRKDYYKVAAFLDYLSENGSDNDRPVCKCPGGRIYMHCINGFETAAERHSEKRLAKSSICRAGPGSRKHIKTDHRFFTGRPSQVCVLLYGRFGRNEGDEDTYVLLHHFFTDRVPGGVPLLHMYLAVRKLQAHRRLQ